MANVKLFADKPMGQKLYAPDLSMRVIKRGIIVKNTLTVIWPSCLGCPFNT